jgi:hypothetical protein
VVLFGFVSCVVCLFGLCLMFCSVVLGLIDRLESEVVDHQTHFKPTITPFISAGLMVNRRIVKNLQYHPRDKACHRSGEGTRQRKFCHSLPDR